MGHYWTESILSGSGLKPLGKKYLFCYLIAVYNGGNSGEDYADLDYVFQRASLMVTPPSNIVDLQIRDDSGDSKQVHWLKQIAHYAAREKYTYAISGNSVKITKKGIKYAADIAFGTKKTDILKVWREDLGWFKNNYNNALYQKTGETRSYGEKEEAAVNRGRAKAAAQKAEYNRQAKEYENGLKEKKKKHEQWKAVQNGKVQNIFVYICAAVAIWAVIGKIACLINVNAGIAILSPLFEGVMFVMIGAFYGLLISFFVNHGQDESKKFVLFEKLKYWSLRLFALSFVVILLASFITPEVVYSTMPI